MADPLRFYMEPSDMLLAGKTLLVTIAHAIALTSTCIKYVRIRNYTKMVKVDSVVILTHA